MCSARSEWRAPSARWFSWMRFTTRLTRSSTCRLSIAISSRMSAYKFYGPHVGVLFGKLDLLESINFPKLIPAPDAAPENVETGTQNQEGMVGAGAAVDFLASLAGEGVEALAFAAGLR